MKKFFSSMTHSGNILMECLCYIVICSIMASMSTPYLEKIHLWLAQLNDIAAHIK
ncbi:MAG: hypothetical protein ACON5A_04305 [Candidatus Comchoanobacterales bacterium]